MRTLVHACLALLASFALAAPASAARQLPHGFLGVVADGPLLEPGFDLAAETTLMAASGVESVRAAFYWASAQPYATASAVPEAERPRFRDERGVPTDFAKLDAIVTAAARRRLRVLPVVHLAPDWAARHPGSFASPPVSVGPYARFLAVLVRRYGPRGSLWAERPELPRTPIRAWQVWNEPNLTQFWSDQPFASDYTDLLRAARRAVRAEDRDAKIVLAGLTNRSWEALATVYRQGARPHFDLAAVHPFTARVSNMLRLVGSFRRVMRRYRDAAKPLLVTETSWTSARGRIDDAAEEGWETSEAGQAARLREALGGLVAARRSLGIAGVWWYSWISADVRRDYSFDHAGLRSGGPGGVRSKPALAAFRSLALRLEGRR